jgi:bifunctional UDP-N-acetylglucosamine pyrophosphorylase / glucosamine-1-phosphate N-acetyltransferase
MNKRLVVLIPAAGGETRLRSETAKVLRSLLGKSLLVRAIETARALDPRRIIVVAGQASDQVAAAAREAGAEVVIPKDRRGTAPALAAAKTALAAEEKSDLLILPADRPLLRVAALDELLTYHRRRKAALTVLSAELADPHGFDRVERGGDGILRVVRENRAEPAVLAIPEVNAGIYVARVGVLSGVLARIRCVDGECDLADAAERLSSRGARVEAFMTPFPGDILPVRTRADEARAAAVLRDRINGVLMDAGVTLIDPATAWIDEQVRIAPDAVIAPFVVMEGPASIGRRSKIGPGCHIVRCAVGEDVVVAAHTVMEDAVIENGVRVGPFARLRPQTILRTGAHVGNFVEMKATDFGPGAKAGHLSYLGDSQVGADVNIGAGTITCNYDGVRKNRTTIGPGAFIGSGSELIAPVAIGRGAYVAAGSAITKDVAADALAVARGRQVEKPEWAKQRREKIELEKRPYRRPK